MSKQTAANVIFVSHISEKSCSYRITTFWFSISKRVFPSPEMCISNNSNKVIQKWIFCKKSYGFSQTSEVVFFRQRDTALNGNGNI